MIAEMELCRSCYASSNWIASVYVKINFRNDAIYLAQRLTPVPVRIFQLA